MTKKFYGKGIPNIKLSELTGTLICIEGADGSGRSSQVRLLRDWLERAGYPTTETGLKRSMLVGPELEAAMAGNTLGPTTLSLFYATDLADQIENTIIPALRAGFVVLADRYIYTTMVRDIVRGAPPEWISNVYGIALIPDIIFYLKVSPKMLVERSFQKQGQLNYWEAGMDIQRSGDMYQCFIRYQTEMAKEYDKISGKYGFKEINGSLDPNEVHRLICEQVKPVLKARKTQVTTPQIFEPVVSKVKKKNTSTKEKRQRPKARARMRAE